MCKKSTNLVLFPYKFHALSLILSSGAILDPIVLFSGAIFDPIVFFCCAFQVLFLVNVFASLCFFPVLCLVLFLVLVLIRLCFFCCAFLVPFLVSVFASLCFCLVLSVSCAETPASENCSTCPKHLVQVLLQLCFFLVLFRRFSGACLVLSWCFLRALILTPFSIVLLLGLYFNQRSC